MSGSLKRIFSGLVAMALAACGNEPQQKIGQNQIDSGVLLTVKALQVKSSAPRVLTGDFEIRAPQPGEQSVDSSGLGGACLIAQVPITPKACHSDQQCKISIGTGKADWYGYCLSGTCWVKPDDSYCLKHVGVGSYSTPAKDTNEVYAYVADQGERPPINWRVLGCLNGVGVNPNNRPGCAGPPADAIHDAGDPVPVQ